MELSRRTFLRTTAAAAAVIVFAEPLRLLSASGDWIEDKGDFLIVRIPDGKTFAKEVLKKPAIVLMGAGSLMRDVEVIGFANIRLNNSRVDGCSFDARSMRTELKREVVRLDGEKGVFAENCVWGVKLWGAV